MCRSKARCSRVAVACLEHKDHLAFSDCLEQQALKSELAVIIEQAWLGRLNSAFGESLERFGEALCQWFQYINPRFLFLQKAPGGCEGHELRLAAPQSLIIYLFLICKAHARRRETQNVRRSPSESSE